MIPLAIIWTVSAFASALLARRKGRIPFAMFCWGLLIGPFAVVWMLLVDPMP